MKIEYRETKAPGIVQITTVDERWYYLKEKNLFYPSSTWICSYYPKGVQFYKWLAEKGWDESQAIKEAAGNKGSRVHHAIEALVLGNEININDTGSDSNGEFAEFSVEEWECIMSFSEWWKETKPALIHTEQVVVNEEHGYAGTIDLVLKIGEQEYIVDIKTAQTIWPEHELQLSSYLHAYIPDLKIAVLQVGYKKNKRNYKFTELDDKFDLFLAAKKIWASENENKRPHQREYPTKIKLEL